MTVPGTSQSASGRLPTDGWWSPTTAPFDDPPDPDQRAQFEVTVGSGVSDDTTSSEGGDPQSTIPDDENEVTPGS
ncbi:MAG: hypothetical protein GY929_04345 [Actinomycetia bacterium]|nr:hypothetical protein [Actinomycetes bacterium]